MGSFWLWGWWFFLTLPDRLSCPLFIYMVHFEFEFTPRMLERQASRIRDLMDDAIDAVTSAITLSRAGRSFEIPVVAFFCVMMSREVLDAVGFLDEGFGRALQAYQRRLPRE